MKSTTEKLAAYAAQCTYKDLPETVIVQAKRCFIDTIGVTLAASKSPTAKILTGLVKALSGKPQASVLKLGFKTTVLNASLLNGSMAHVLDFDDLHSAAMTHTSAVLVPAALSGGEWKRRNGKEIITAFVTGFEVVARVSKAAGTGQRQLELGWHPTSTMGRIGAAVCFGKLLHLDTQQLAKAIAIAATQAAGLRRVFGTMTKHLNAGKPAHDGVFAALLAHRGFSAPTNILEGEDGLCQVLSRNFDPKQITNGLGKRFEILQNSFKLYPSCRQTHAVIDACLDITKKLNFDLSNIKEVICEVNPLAPQTAGIKNPRDASEAKFSLHYCAARGLMGDVSMRSFGTKALENEKARKLMKYIKIKTNSSYNIANAQVVVKTTDGRQAKSKIDIPKGSPSNPMSDDDIDSKFSSLALPLIKDEKKTKDILHLLWGLEREKNINKLIRFLN